MESSDEVGAKVDCAFDWAQLWEGDADLWEDVAFCTTRLAHMLCVSA